MTISTTMKFWIGLAATGMMIVACTDPVAAQAADLHNYAEQSEHLADLQALLDAGEDPNAKDIFGATPLYWAVTGENVAGVSALLEAGANPNWALADDGTTPLHWAAIDGSSRIVRLLIEAGADPNAADGRCRTPLNFAATAMQNRTVIMTLIQDVGGVMGRGC